MGQKVWMVTGASRGLGAEVAKAALSSGDKVIATGRNKEELDNPSHQDTWLAVSMDVTYLVLLKKPLQKRSSASIGPMSSDC
jgi:NADP-dependent 3-hydroxy acid dehydrogenase YdfG